MRLVHGRTLIGLLQLILVMPAPSCAQSTRVVHSIAATPQQCPALGVPDVMADVLHYDVSLRVAESADRIPGTAKVTVRMLSAGQVLALDARDLRVEAVHDGETSACFEQDPRGLRIRLARPTSPGDERVITVTYEASSSRGLRLSSNIAFTVFHTNSWLPCRFDPGDKATLTLKLEVPSGWSAAATGDLQSARGGAPDGFVSYEFVLQKPYSAYLLGFVAGRFSEHRAAVGEVELRFLGQRRSSDQLAKIFAATAPALRFFVERSGLPFPGTSYAQALVPIGSGQELAGLSLLSERYSDDVLRDEHEDWLVVHELSHQWWGNLVTCAEWRDFWMHEAFATFMTAAFKEIRWGREAYLREVQLARKRYGRLRSEGRDRALAPSGTPTAEDVGGPLPYAKGMLVLHHLRKQLGDEIFFHAIRRFTQAHAGGSVTSQMLREAFENEAGADLSGFFNDFVFGIRPLPESD